MITSKLININLTLKSNRIHFIALNPVIVDKCGHRWLWCDPNFYLF